MAQIECILVFFLQCATSVFDSECLARINSNDDSLGKSSCVVYNHEIHEKVRFNYFMAVKFAACVASYLWFHSLLYHKDIRRYCITRYLSLKIFRELYLCSLCGLHKKKTRRPEKDLHRVGSGRRKRRILTETASVVLTKQKRLKEISD